MGREIAKREMKMGSRPRWRTVVLALGLIAALAIATPVLGLDSSIKKAIKKEVAKQISKATGPAGATGAPGAPGEPGTARAYARVIHHAGDDCTGGCTFDRAKGVTSVNRLEPGTYCVIAPGLSPTTTTASVTVDASITSSPKGNASAMISAGFRAAAAASWSSRSASRARRCAPTTPAQPQQTLPVTPRWRTTSGSRS
jgi:hypothetical protein